MRQIAHVFLKCFQREFNFVFSFLQNFRYRLILKPLWATWYYCCECEFNSLQLCSQTEVYWFASRTATLPQISENLNCQLSAKCTFSFIACIASWSAVFHENYESWKYIWMKLFSILECFCPTRVCTTAFPKGHVLPLFRFRSFKVSQIPPPYMTSQSRDSAVTTSCPSPSPLPVQCVDGAEEVADGPGGAAQAGVEEGEGEVGRAVRWPQRGARQPEGAAADLRDLQPEERRGMDSSPPCLSRSSY